ncbi:hypothetical protein BDY19DRAFT_996900 [Irpex rosettiformis]|uniref:Uncharacterized protein n=1 Tax=Irpex rosettiformis TaxID=378272 RepID=A0ACB8TTL6_9APHY|nr:hypothetical protein BDY19DRAFT_996900 [Irpex rosettiformis]
MFATRSKLGYDPSISPAERTRDQRTTKYSIKVTGQGREATYVTHQVLVNINAEAMQGRATRVWRGKKADEKGRPAGHNTVIKDCWIDTDRKREGDILAEILEAARTSTNPDHLVNIKNHFLTVVHHGDVLVDGVKDTTLSLRRGTDFPEPRKFLNLERCSSTTKEVDKPPVGIVTLDKNTVNWLNKFERADDKSHYRIVFDSEENCDPIDTLTSGRAIWGAMIDALTGVSTLHELGYIHRDISAGNVLVGCGIPGVVQVAMCIRGAPGHVTLEVKNQEYLFAPGNSGSKPEISISEMRRAARRSGKPDTVSPLKTKPRTNLKAQQSYKGPLMPPFVNNPLHDLESL